MSWVSLDDKFHCHPKTSMAGNAGAGLYARCLSFCGDQLTDGWVPRGYALSLGSPGLCKKLVSVGLWLQVVAGETFDYSSDKAVYVVIIPDVGFFIADYLEFNPTRAEVLAKRQELSEKRAAAGRKGAQVRWQRNGKPYGKQHGKPMAKGMANG